MKVFVLGRKILSISSTTLPSIPVDVHDHMLQGTGCTGSGHSFCTCMFL